MLTALNSKNLISDTKYFKTLAHCFAFSSFYPRTKCSVHSQAILSPWRCLPPFHASRSGTIMNLCSYCDCSRCCTSHEKSLETPLDVLCFQKPQVFLRLAAHPAIMSGGHSLLLITLSLSTIIPAGDFKLWLGCSRWRHKTFKGQSALIRLWQGGVIVVASRHLISLWWDTVKKETIKIRYSKIKFLLWPTELVTVKGADRKGLHSEKTRAIKFWGDCSCWLIAAMQLQRQRKPAQAGVTSSCQRRQHDRVP